MSTPANRVTLPLSGYQAEHFQLAVADRVATITLDRFARAFRAFAAKQKPVFEGN